MRILFLTFIFLSSTFLSGCNKTELTQEFFKKDYSVTAFEQFLDFRYVNLKDTDTGKEHTLFYSRSNCEQETLPSMGKHYSISGVRYYSIDGDTRESLEYAKRLFCRKNHG